MTTPVTGVGSAAELAARYGLDRSGARPSLPTYAKQLWERRHFIVNLASARNAAQFTDSALGQAWQVLTPLLNAGVYFLIFGLLLDTSRGIENFTAFLVTGVFVFTFTQRTLIAGARAISGNLGLVRALHFPRATLPLASTVMELQQLLVSMLVLAVIVLVTGEPLTLQWLLLIPALVLQTLFNAGLAMAFARLAGRVRDLTQLLPFAVRTWQYVSGIFFSINVFAADSPRLVQWVLDVNPAAVYIEICRDALMTSYRADAHMWPLAVVWAVVMFVVGFWYFWKAEERYGRG